MFITKKKFERAIEKAKEEAIREVDKCNHEFEIRKRTNECLSDIDSRLCALERKPEGEAREVRPSKYWL